MDVLRIATAGSVDDGKSTLIGRLLYETGSVTADRLEGIRHASARRGHDGLDLSLLTDGLLAEREQGITIDVAHVYFATSRRKFIIADTPGHVEYTRNMVTGASTALLSIILIDVRHGLVEQTYRHFFIASLLRIPEIVVCVNKMDMVGFERARFDEISFEVQAVSERLRLPAPTLRVVPISSLHGDNVVRRSARTGWYEGPPLLEILEQAQVERSRHQPIRLHIQMVIRSARDDDESRRYAGRLSSGRLALGDAVQTWPGGRVSRVRHLERNGEPAHEAYAGHSVTVQLSDAIDVGRGSLLASPSDGPRARRELVARLCWLDHEPSVTGQVYLLQHGVRRVRARLQTLVGVMDVRTFQIAAHPELQLNDIGTVVLRLTEPIFADDYAVNPSNGAFMLIDEHTHQTSAVGFVDPDVVTVDPTTPEAL